MFESWILLMRLFNSKNLLTMWFQQKSSGCWHRSVMQRSTFPPFAFISGALYCIPFCSLYHLKSPVVYKATFNKVARYTWESQRPAMTPRDVKKTKKASCYFKLKPTKWKRGSQSKCRDKKSRGRWLSRIGSKSSVIPFNPPQWSKCSISRHTQWPVQWQKSR